MKARLSPGGTVHFPDKGIWLSVAVFVLLAMAIAVLTVSYYRHRARNVRAEKQAYLGETLQLKIAQIVQWRRELTNDALIIQNNPFLSSIMETWIENPGQSTLSQEIERWIWARHQTERYLGISLVDSEGRIRLAVPERTAMMDGGTLDSLSMALRTGQICFSDLHRATPGGEVIVEIIVPLLSKKGIYSPSPGAIILRVDAETFLFPMIQSWPASATAEVVLVRREGDHLLVLNELRHIKNTALALQSPLLSFSLPETDSALGKGHIHEGIDYRGVPVVAATRAVPGSPWFLMAKQDEEEVFASLRRNLGLVLLLAFSLISLAGITVALLQRRSLATHYRRLYEVEKEKIGLDRSLSVSEAKYKDLIDNINDVVLTTGSDGIITFVSGVAERMLGYNPSEVLGRHIWDFVSPRDTSVTKNRFETLRNGHAQENEYAITTKTGEKRWIRTSSRPVYEEGTLKCCYVVIRDITPSKKAEDELRESEERFRRLSEAAFEAIVIHEGGVLLSANDQFFNMFGYEPEELLGIYALPLLFTQESVEATRKEIARGGLGPYEVIGLKKDGTRFPIEIRAREVEYEGRMVRVAISMDVTERKRAEKALRENEEKYRKILESIAEGYYEVDLAGNLTFFNDSVCEALGYSRDDLMSMNVRQYTDAQGVKEVYRGFNEVYMTGKPKKGFGYEIIRRDGTRRVVEVSVKLMRDEEGNPVGFCGIVRDVTERKQGEEEKKKLEAQLHQAHKMEAIGTLAGGIAHDFNNILTGIMGYSEMALMDLPEKSEAKTCIEQVLKAGHRARELVRQILAFSRRSEASPKPVKVTPLVKETVRFLRSSLPSTIQIQANTEAEKDVVLADPTHIHQIIMNLCTNAHHAMRDKGGVLGIEVKNVQIGPETVLSNLAAIPGRYLALAVSDTGCGIDPANLTRIFEPYFTTKEKDEGTGLGLAVVHGTVTQLGGDVTVQSEPGKGTEFKVLIPVIEDEEMPLDSCGPVPKGTGLILFVDDEPDICDLARRMLHYLGYEVDVRISGLEALEAFKYQPNKFDLIITDMTMPHMTGERLAKEVMLLRPDLPVILCTGFSELMTEERAKSLGIKARLLKPLIMRDVATTIHKVFSECRN